MLNNRKIKLKIKEKEIIQKHIATEFIRLDAFLKLCDAVQSGGHAKIVIQDGEEKNFASEIKSSLKIKFMR